MSANVESMFYAGREKPWHGLGTQVEEAPTSADALRLAGLDWTVQRKPIQVCGGRKVDNFFANVRSSDGAVLGVVSDRYQVVQNAEAFAFTDALIGGEGQVHYETAGSLMGGRKIWLLAKLPDTEIVGDKTEPYLCFSNTHDGSGATVDRIHILGNGQVQIRAKYFVTDNIYLYPDMFGKTVFLTCAEAEAAIEARKGGKE